MDGQSGGDQARAVDTDAKKELSKRNGGKNKGIKLYLVSEITHKLHESEAGVGYWFPDAEDKTQFEPGFAVVEAGQAEMGRLLAHELGHALGGLDDGSVKDNLMNPSPGVNDKNALTDEQCKRLVQGASKRS